MLNKRISASDYHFPTLVALARWRARQQADQTIYSFLADGDTEKRTFSFADLDLHARAIAATLQEHVESGERAILIYPSGLEFIAAFFGCLYSGVIAVPVYPPSTARSDHSLDKFRAIAENAEASVILTSESLSSRVRALLERAPELQATRVIVSDEIDAAHGGQWREPKIDGSTLAFLQYTSGSTGTPKGVMVTHANLLHNSVLVENYCQHPDDAHGVTWLPLYHDLGLIGGVIQPLYAGYESTIMAPTTFLQRPFLWLQAVSRTHATISGGPNFAFDLCVRKVTPEQKKTLDLSRWSTIANGAEPVRPDTMQRFAEAFTSCGLRANYFYPCYGLAEATLVVSAGTYGVYPTVATFQREGIEHNQAILVGADGEHTQDATTLVSIGRSQADQTVLIVDAETHVECAADRIGEIWVKGPSVAQGYWQRPQESEETFHAYLATNDSVGNDVDNDMEKADEAGPFLRTGDLGFMHHDELFITGRLKDLIIIRGSNYYPQDIEKTVEAAHTGIRLNGSAAFSVDQDGEEKLVVVEEIERTALSGNLDAIISATREAIATQYELQVSTIVLIKPGSLPKTSSGKVQRRGSRQAYLEGSLSIVQEWNLEGKSARPQGDASTRQAQISATSGGSGVMDVAEKSARPRVTVAEVEKWLVSHMATMLKVSQNTIDTRAPFVQYGLDSLQAVTLSGDLEDWLGMTLSPTLVYDYPSIEALAHFLTNTPLTATQAEQEQPLHATDSDAIAVIGLGCRFPGANNPEEFWQLLYNGVDAISEVPATRWPVERYYDAEPATPGKMNTRWGGFLQDVEQFEPGFFNIAPREAVRMDPQQRLLLEVAWETLENAGYAPEKMAGSQTGVFVGISSTDYAQLQSQDFQHIDAYVGTGNAHSISANRLSYFLDLRGPSVAMDTACSSSLLAIHQACQSLRSGESTMALAGGVNLTLIPELTIALSQARMLSPEGRCKTFDENADGYVRGEGCGLVLLKPLAQAQRDGDNILALVRGSAVNQDGRSNGLTAPNGPSQEAVIRQALANAHVQPQQVGYVETHGSSTPLGDPIEVASLKTVLMPQRSAEQKCILGAVKTNVGHLESAAGVAGFIKAVLSLSKEVIPPNIHFQKLNPHIALDGTTFVIPTQPQAWPSEAERIAGVSAFGFGGTNVHVVLEAAPITRAVIDESERPQHLLALSARSASALQQLAARYQEFLQQRKGISLADLCYSANSGRTHFSHRLTITAGSTQQLYERLTAFKAGRAQRGVSENHVTNGTGQQLAFLFTGQGSQYVGMARTLYDTQPTFRRVLDQCDQMLRTYLPQSLLSVIYAEDAEISPLNETAYTQPALFAIEYALAQLWQSWGVEPDIVMGHSIGEYVAACVAGAMSLQDGLKLIAARGRLMQELSIHGAMVAVFANAAQLTPYIQEFEDRISIAVINGPTNTVLSGEETALNKVVRRLQEANISVHAMNVSHAFHSPLLDAMLDEFERTANEIGFQALRIPLVSNTTGEILPVGTLLDAAYWRTQTRQAVQFEKSMQTLANAGYDMFLEIGPHTTLTSMGKRCLPNGAGTWLSSLQKEQDNWSTLLGTVAALYTHGFAIDWSGFDHDYHRKRIPLPTYPFERQRYWLGEQAETTAPAAARQATALPSQQAATNNGYEHPLLHTHISLAAPASVHVWESSLNVHDLAYLRDHRIQGAIALPLSVYIEMAQTAATQALQTRAHTLKEIELKKLLFLAEEGEQKVQVILAPDSQQQLSFSIYSHGPGEADSPRDTWSLYATGKIGQN